MSETHSDVRDRHAHRLATLWCDQADANDMAMVLLTERFRKPTAAGTVAGLVLHHVHHRGRKIKVACQLEDLAPWTWQAEHCYFLATPRQWTIRPPLQGVLIDPWGIYPAKTGLAIVRPDPPA